MELFTWLRSRPDISIIVLQETHWGFTNDWVQDEWRFCHSGMSKGKQGGVLVGVRKDKVKPEDISWTELEPGRLLHWRCAYGKQQLDVVAVYQHALSHRTEEQRAKLMQQRKSLWNKLDKVLASLPFRTSIILAGDFNAVLNPSAGLTTGAGIHAGPKQSGIAEDRALLMRVLGSHRLTALNTWGKKHTTYHHPQGDSQIDYVLVRQQIADSKAKTCRPITD